MRQRQGFTLIELLVVLMILSLASALVLPKFPAIYDNFKSKSEQEQFFQSLAVLPLQAYTKQQAIVLDQASAASILGLPDGWELKLEQPIVYQPNGFCRGGTISYTAKAVTHSITLLPPYCDPSAL